MVLTNYARQALTWAIGSNITNNFVSYCTLGSGSGTALVSDTILVGEAMRGQLTGSPDFTVNREVGFQFDFGATTLSGLSMTEFGLQASGAFQTGSLWQREAFGSIAFDGTNELQLQSKFAVI